MRLGLMAVAAVSVALVQTPGAWVPQQSPVPERLRGISAISADVAWASGNKGTVVRTVDGGVTWAVVSPPGSAALDFRDVEAFDASTAYVLAIGPGDKSRIYKTLDGGRSWALQFSNGDPERFFDAIAFWDAASGLAVGDPVDGRFTVIRTMDGGATWVPIPAGGMPPALEGDGAFAASGTCLVTFETTQAWIGSGGGARARVFRSTDKGLTWRVSDTPVMAGLASAGIFSLAFSDASTGVAVGGDYRQEQGTGDNLARTTDGGATWSMIGATRLRSFRSAVAYLPGSRGRSVLVAGPAGTDRSDDGGVTWRPTGDVGYHALSIARDGTVWVAGEDGRIARGR